MLGRNRPGSEGNLASDFENQDMTPAENGEVEAPKVETPKVETAKPEVTKNDVVKEAPPKRARAEKHHAESKNSVETKAPAAEPVAVAEVMRRQHRIPDPRAAADTLEGSRLWRRSSRPIALDASR